MNVQRVNLPVAGTWDAAEAPAHYIQQARYAVLREGRVELAMGQCAGTVATMLLAYAGHEGLHYDADSSLSPAAVQTMLRLGSAELTQEWATCEQYLVNSARALGLPNH